jgi:ribosomal 50S subunit-associated protein YjgA (DUF615 family)
MDAARQVNQRSINMIKRTAVSVSGLVLCLSMLAAAPVSAEPTAAAARQASLNEHRQEMDDMMKKMYQELRQMMKDMKGGDVTSEKMKQMDKHMQRMTNMLHGLSGPRDQMLKEMDEMRRDPSMKPPA